MRQNDFIQLIESIAPLHGAAQWDNCGMQVASTRDDVVRVTVALDPTPATITQSISQGVDFILTHHPLALKPQALNKLNGYHHAVSLLLSNHIALYSAHTSLDVNPRGPVGWLAVELGLQQCQVLEKTHASTLCTYFIPSREEKIITALEALAFLQRIHHLQGGITVCFDSARITTDSALSGIRKLLPPGVPIIAVEQGPDGDVLGFGIIGTLPTPLTPQDFIKRLAHITGGTSWTNCGPCPDTIQTVAYCTGSGSSLAKAAFARGADVFITGDVKYHTALDSTGYIMDVGHFLLEEEMMRRFAKELQNAAPELDITFLPAQDPIKFCSVS